MPSARAPKGGKSHSNEMGNHGALWPYSPGSTLPGKAQPHPLNFSPNFDVPDNPVQCCSALSMGLALTSHWGLWDACWRMPGIPSMRSNLGSPHRTPIATLQGEAASGAIPRRPPLPPLLPLRPWSSGYQGRGLSSVSLQSYSPALHTCPLRRGDGARTCFKQRHRETRQREGWLNKVALAVTYRHRFLGNAGHCRSVSDSDAPKCHGMPAELMLRWRS